jgi:hypothetical protein
VWVNVAWVSSVHAPSVVLIHWRPNSARRFFCPFAGFQSSLNE